jgi:hypothetical protein
MTGYPLELYDECTPMTWHGLTSRFWGRSTGFAVKKMMKVRMRLCLR